MNSPFPISRRQFVTGLSAAAIVASLPRSLGAPPAPAKKLGIALLGLGSYATHQLAPALGETQFCRLAGVITGTRGKAERWQRRHGLPARNVYSYETMDRIADNPDIDIIYVVTPPGTHRDFVLRAAKAGKHVICEKPMAVSVAECDEMIAACKQAGRRLSIGYRLQFEPHHIAMEKFARDPATGPARKMHGGHGFFISGGVWRVEKKLAGGGPMPDVGIYVVQAACRAAGAVPVAVLAKEGPKTRPEIFKDVEESMRWTMEFPGGATCEGFTSYSEPANDFRVQSDRGWFELKPAFSYGGIRGETNAGRLEIPNLNQQAVQMDDFARCILDHRETSVPGEMGRRDIAILEAVYASAAAGGTRVPVKV